MAKAKDFKFCTLVATIIPEMINCPSNGCGCSQITNFNFWGPKSYLWNDCSYSCQILYTCKPY